MPKEVRALLFSAEEVRAVVEQSLNKGMGGRREPVERVEVEMVDGVLHTRAYVGRGPEPKLTMVDPQELMSAILVFCKSIRIPLSTRAIKKLDAAGTGLMLTMSLNQDPAGPRIQGNAIDYTAPVPAPLTERIAALRE